jgi:single-strand DNA-binding protein
MSEIINKVQLLGNVGKNPKIITTNNGKKLAMFSIATTEVFFRNGEKSFETQWHFAKAWGNVAEEIEERIKPGTKITIDGKLSNRSYTDKNGEKKYVTEVIVTEFEIVNKA